MTFEHQKHLFTEALIGLFYVMNLFFPDNFLHEIILSFRFILTNFFLYYIVLSHVFYYIIIRDIQNI